MECRLGRVLVKNINNRIEVGKGDVEGYGWCFKNEGHKGVPLDIHNPNLHRSTTERAMRDPFWQLKEKE